MKNIYHLKTISDVNKFLHQDFPRHPLLSAIDFSKMQNHSMEPCKITSDFYFIILKNNCQNKLKYGRMHFDFEQGMLLCVSPKQVIEISDETNDNTNVEGFGLFFHPDLIRKTPLAVNIKRYSFFSYNVNEALHLSEKEKRTLYDCISKINSELQENIDAHSQTLIVSNIELLLNYCLRYYERQFFTRKAANSDILTKIEILLTNYFQQTDLIDKGLPTVKYLADQVHLSSNYLSDLLKRETGMNAQERIHYFVIEEAKNLLLNSGKTVGELAFSLGFEYPQYFSRLFKAKTGMTPIEYRGMN